MTVLVLQPWHQVRYISMKKKPTRFRFNIRGEAVELSSGSNRLCFCWVDTKWTVSCMLFWSLPQLISPRYWGTPTSLHGSLMSPTPNWLLFLFGFSTGNKNQAVALLEAIVAPWHAAGRWFTVEQARTKLWLLYKVKDDGCVLPPDSFTPSLSIIKLKSSCVFLWGNIVVILDKQDKGGQQ